MIVADFREIKFEWEYDISSVLNFLRRFMSLFFFVGTKFYGFGQNIGGALGCRLIDRRMYNLMIMFA